MYVLSILYFEDNLYNNDHVKITRNLKTKLESVLDWVEYIP